MYLKSKTVNVSSISSDTLSSSGLKQKSNKPQQLSLAFETLTISDVKYTLCSFTLSG